MKEYNPDETVLLLHEEGQFDPPPSEVVEVPLLLSLAQMTALEAAAHGRGLTAGEMVRRVLQDFIGGPSLWDRPGTTKIAAC